MARNKYATFGTVWTFKTARFEIKLTLERDYGYRYDGDDEGGEVQAKLDSGEYVAFESAVTVYLDGEEIGANYLGGSVYSYLTVSEFYTAHRGIDPMNRNCSIMRRARGNCTICHYFPDMVLEAVKEARQAVAAMRNLPKLRNV